MDFLNDINSKISAKRIIGIIGSLVVMVALFFMDKLHIPETTIIGLATVYAGLLASTVFEKKQDA